MKRRRRAGTFLIAIGTRFIPCPIGSLFFIEGGGQICVLTACDTFICAVGVPPARVIAVRTGLSFGDDVRRSWLIRQFLALGLRLSLVNLPEPSAQMLGEE